MDGGGDAPKGFAAPQPELFSSIIEGILGGTLEWGLFGIGALIAIAMELAGVCALPFAVGMYLPISVSTPIFAGGMSALVGGEACAAARPPRRRRKPARACCCRAAISRAARCADSIIAFLAVDVDAVKKFARFCRLRRPWDKSMACPMSKRRQWRKLRPR